MLNLIALLIYRRALDTVQTSVKAVHPVSIVVIIYRVGREFLTILLLFRNGKKIS